LRNLVERGVILADGTQLTGRDLSDLATSTTGAAPVDAPLELASLEEGAIRAAFEQSGGNQTETARLLGIGVDALRYRLRKYGLR
jgi:DNA-binding NtrC family response regulator